MSGFWPDGLDVSDTQSPMDILQSARDEWETNSGGLLTLVFQEAKTTTGNTMIVVHAKHAPDSRTTTLFSVVHRPNAPYPATIQPEKEELPKALRKSYYQPGIGEIGLTGVQGREVKNEWVSDTPTEFRTKLKNVFNLGSVKRSVLSLVVHSPVPEKDAPGGGHDDTTGGESNNEMHPTN